MLQQVEKFTDYIQVDIMDGIFVLLTVFHVKTCRKASAVQWEAHLMVQYPEKYFTGYQNSGAQKVIFHYEATKTPEKSAEAAHRIGLEAGLAVNPETPISSILALSDYVDSILFLSVYPGYYGAKFIPETLEKISVLRKAKPEVVIGIDGGIKESNIACVAQSGVNEICVGSAILSQPDPADSYRKLLSLANGREYRAHPDNRYK
jgi:ribulose-phosphate 3-epimerase